MSSHITHEVARHLLHLHFGFVARQLPGY